MTMQTEEINTQVKFNKLKSKFTVSRPESIRDKVAAWAFENAEKPEAVIACLEGIDCAGCHSPAPIYYNDMAAELATHWPDIGDALGSYRDATGEAWAPKENQNFLTYLWFAYEWTAYELANQIRSDIESGEE
jgi:hypothetical protein